jgi:ATP-binding cassette, subfamily F, member 3
MLANPENTAQKARDICGSLMFENDMALKKIKVLSGGEKSRVLLGRILASNINLLLLDEPSNHLDMEASDALLSAIDNFEGAVVIVTHNEMFLHSIAERLIVFDNGKTAVFEGSYEDFLEKVGWNSEKEEDAKEQIESNASYNKENRKKRAAIVMEKSKILKPVENKYKQLEKEILSVENELELLNKEFNSATLQNDGKKITKLSRGIHSKDEELKKLYEDLDAVMNLYAEKSKEFDIKLGKQGV